MAIVYESSRAVPYAPPSTLIPVPASGQRVAACDWHGTPAFIKRTGRQRQFELAMLTLIAPMVRALVGSALPAPRPFVPAVRPASPAFEVQRLAELREAGVRVPRVLASSEEVFVIESAGRPLEKVLAQTRNGESRLEWMLSAAEDLAAFHTNGHWHGNAQVRNIAVSGNGFARFDFDRDIDRHFPLEIIQAVDVFLFLSSLADRQDRDVLGRIAERYATAAPPTAMLVLARCHRLLTPVVRSGFLQKLGGKEMTRLRAVHTALAAPVQATLERAA